MLGGLTFSEMRVAYEVAAAQNPPAQLLIGSTATLTPSDLSGLTRKNSMRECSRHHRLLLRRQLRQGQERVLPH
jgi:hypothetical protein